MDRVQLLEYCEGCVYVFNASGYSKVGYWLPIKWPAGLKMLIGPSKIHRHRKSHLQFLCAYDWEATPVGKRAKWSLELRVTLNLLNSEPERAVVYWGDEMKNLYNEPLVALIGQKHHSILGHGPKNAFPEILLINQRVLQKQSKKIFKNVHVASYGLEALEALRKSRH